MKKILFILLLVSLRGYSQIPVVVVPDTSIYLVFNDSTVVAEVGRCMVASREYPESAHIDFWSTIFKQQRTDLDGIKYWWYGIDVVPNSQDYGHYFLQCLKDYVIFLEPVDRHDMTWKITDIK